MDEEKYKQYFEILEIEENAPLTEVKLAYDRLIKLYTSESIVIEPIDDEFNEEDKQEIIDEIEEAYQGLLRFIIERDREGQPLANKNLPSEPERIPEPVPVPIQEPPPPSLEEEISPERAFQLADTLVEEFIDNENTHQNEESEPAEVSKEIEEPEEIEEPMELEEPEEIEDIEFDIEIELPDAPLELGEAEELLELPEPSDLLSAGELPQQEDTVPLHEPLQAEITHITAQSTTAAEPVKTEPSDPTDLLSEDHPITQAFSDAPAGETNKFPDSGQTMVKPGKAKINYPKDATMLRIDELTKAHSPYETSDRPAMGPEPIYKGRTLKKIRENLKLGIHEIAIATRINYKILVNIEKEKFDTLPEGGLLRWHVITYAKALKLDSQVVAEDYMRRYRRWQKKNNPQ